MSPASDASATPGRTRIVPRAIRKVAAAVTAAELGVNPDDVRIDLSDDRGELRIRAAAPILVGSALPGTILERGRAAQGRTRERVTELTGATVAAVDLTVTGAVTGRVRRVQ